jgi:hypothetical protein
VAAWLGLFTYWIVNGSEPACQVTSVFHGGQVTAVTRSCGLPDVSDYIYVLGLVALLLMPDAASITLGVFKFERILSRATKLARAAGAGDTPKNARSADDVLKGYVG